MRAFWYWAPVVMALGVGLFLVINLIRSEARWGGWEPTSHSSATWPAALRPDPDGVGWQWQVRHNGYVVAKGWAITRAGADAKATRSTIHLQTPKD